MTKAEEILTKHLELRSLTNEHIHVAAYMACLDAIDEALNISVFPSGKLYRCHNPMNLNDIKNRN